MRFFLFYVGLFLSFSVFGQELKPEFRKTGDQAPNFTIKTLDGSNFTLSDYRGKVVFLNFFATWCGSCMKEMPHVESEIWQQIKHSDFVMLAIAREQKNDEIKKFKTEKQYTMPMAADQNRLVYNLFAPQYIPRNIIIDRTGKMIYFERGYTEPEFKKMLKVLKTALGE